MVDTTINKPIIGSKALRKGRRSIAGELYFLTTAADESFGRIDDSAIFTIIVRKIEGLETEKVWQWFGMVVMPDHLHMIVRLRHRMNLSEAVRRFKGGTAREINIMLGRSGPVWFEGFYDRLIRDDEPVTNYVQYMVENPVRKGLVNGTKDWPYTQVRWEMVPEFRR